jgi:hypothetical protein
MLWMVLHRPIETTAVTGDVPERAISLARFASLSGL